MTENIIRKEKTKNAALLFFAFVGFIASFISVYEYFRPSSGSILSISGRVDTFRVPLYAGGALQNSTSGREYASELRSDNCADVAVPGIATITLGELAELEIPEEEVDAAIICKDAIDVEYAARFAGIYSSGYGTIYTYQLDNSGTEIARDIRLADDEVLTAQYRRGSEFVELKKQRGDEFYRLPELNPGETLTLLAWTGEYHPTERYLDAEDFPALTYSGPAPSFVIAKRIEGAWGEIGSFFEGTPWPIAIVILGAIGVLLLLALVFVISIVDALINGKPISSIFKSDQEAAEDDLIDDLAAS